MISILHQGVIPSSSCSVCVCLCAWTRHKIASEILYLDIALVLLSLDFNSNRLTLSPLCFDAIRFERITIAVQIELLHLSLYFTKTAGGVCWLLLVYLCLTM